MPGINYFVGQPRDWLETQLALAQADIAAGKTLRSWGAGDSNGSREVQMSPQTRIELLTQALSVIDPITYPPGSSVRVRKTTPRYIWGQ